jgi:hypothetical protein
MIGAVTIREVRSASSLYTDIFFGLHRFGQQTLIGVYRWFILCWISFILVHWVYLSTSPTDLPDWSKAAALTLQLLLPEVLVCLLLIQVEQSRHLLQSFGFDLRLVEVKT